MMGAAIRDWVNYNKGRKLFDACKYKGTFANCKPEVCIRCHKEKQE